jgi:hypothetical protein
MTVPHDEAGVFQERHVTNAASEVPGRDRYGLGPRDRPCSRHCSCPGWCEGTPQTFWRGLRCEEHAVEEHRSRDSTQVVVADIDARSGEETARLIRDARGDAHFHHVDVRVDESVRDCVRFAEEKFGRVDVLVNNAVRYVFGAASPRLMWCRKQRLERRCIRD